MSQTFQVQQFEMPQFEMPDFEMKGRAMTVPDELRYTAEHEWVAIDGAVASVGVTDYAQRSLGDVVYVSVPAPGTVVTAGEPCGEVESTKSVSDIFSPVNGEVIEANPEIEDDPGLVNSDPYGAGWLMRIRLAEQGLDSGSLLTADQYAALVKEAG
jgi:glycine cleavage system H protein